MSVQEQAGKALPERVQQRVLGSLARSFFRRHSQECRKAASGAAPEYAHIERQSMEQLVQHAQADEAWLNQKASNSLLTSRDSVACVPSVGRTPSAPSVWRLSVDTARLQLEEQRSLPHNQDPCISAEEISQRHSDLVSLAKKVLSAPKRKLSFADLMRVAASFRLEEVGRTPLYILYRPFVRIACCACSRAAFSKGRAFRLSRRKRYGRGGTAAGAGRISCRRAGSAECKLPR